ncbi:hypothetical protein Tco_1375059 [Tanacetum coccineum]
MSTRSGPSPTTNTSAVRNTLLPILAEKMHQEKVQQEKPKAVKSRLNFEEASQYSESGAPSRRGDARRRLGPKDARNMSRSPEPRHDRSRSPRMKDPERETVFRRLEKGVFHRLGDKKRVCPHTLVVQGVSHTTAVAKTLEAIIRILAREERSPPLRDIMTEKHAHVREEGCQKARTMQENIGNLNLKSKGQRIRMPSHVKTYKGSEDPEDRLKIFQAAAKVERWAMPTWCHMFNSTLTRNARVWFDDLPPEFIDSYDDLKETFLANYLQQKKCIKDPVRIYVFLT